MFKSILSLGSLGHFLQQSIISELFCHFSDFQIQIINSKGEFYLQLFCHPTEMWGENKVSPHKIKSHHMKYSFITKAP